MNAIAWALLAVGVYESTQLGWWRDFIYLGVAFAIAGAVISEDKG